MSLTTIDGLAFATTLLVGVAMVESTIEKSRKRALSHREYLDNLRQPSASTIRHIAAIQRHNEAEIDAKYHAIDEHEAATRIQQAYRGFRDRRQLEGKTLDPSARWAEAIRELRFRATTTARQPSNSGRPTTPTDKARANWRKIEEVARHAAGDDCSPPRPTDVQTPSLMGSSKRQPTDPMFLDQRYFLEMVDRKHRYGANLQVYHEAWQRSITKQNFFEWLDHGEGRHIILAGCSREKLDSERIRYLSREERRDYEVDVDETGKLRWQKSGELVTTSEDYQDSARGIVARGSPEADQVLPRTEDEDTDEDDDDGPTDSPLDPESQGIAIAPQQAKKHRKFGRGFRVSPATILNQLLRAAVKPGTWIYVADTVGRLYVGIKSSGQFQHASFLAGARISSAGLIGIEKGQLVYLSPLSGHYRPTTKSFKAFIDSLKHRGADLSLLKVSHAYQILLSMEYYGKSKNGLQKVVHHQHRADRKSSGSRTSSTSNIETSIRSHHLHKSLAMWLLSVDGDLFAGKRIWLRPGTEFLLARTSGRNEGSHVRYIDEKSVSRQHLLIKIGSANGDDATQLHKRTSVELTDNSKTGTTLNDERFGKTSKMVEGKENRIKVGRYAHTFHLEWYTVALTCTSLGTKTQDPLSIYKQQLDRTDVKLLQVYVSNETTHVVAKKRNVPFVLQGLIQGRRIVAYSWLDALEAALKRREGSDENGEDYKSLLEQDFDANWPSEDEHFVPIHREPVPRPPEYLKPNPARTEVFSDLVFIFLSQAKYEDLLPVVTSGGGKAVLRNVVIGESTGDDLVDFVKEVAGKKDDTDFRLSQQTGPGGVVVTRMSENDTWTKEFMQSVDEELEQESIVLNEFLDAILMADASGLRRPLMRPAKAVQSSEQRPASRQDQPMEDIVEQPRPVEPATQPEQEVSETTEPPAEPPTTTKKKWNRRVITKSRFQGFDDFDTSQFAEAPPPAFSMREASQVASVQGMEADPSQPEQTEQTQQTQRSSLKRPAATQEAEEEPEDFVAGMLTGQAALKRRKTEAAAKGEKNSFAKSFVEADRLATEKEVRKKKDEKQMNVKAALAKSRKEEEERRRQDEEALREQLEGVDLSELNDLAQIEEMDVPVREHLPPRRAVQGEASGRWDPAWNGRKNFKRFRPQGQQRDGPRPRQVIVPLEEVSLQSNSMGSDYWLDNSTVKAGPARGSSKSQSKSQSQSVRGGRSQAGGDEEEIRFQRRVQKSLEEDVEQTEDTADAIAGTARDDGLRALQEQSQTLGTDTQRKAAGKRPAAAQGGPPAKKAKQMRMPTQAAPVVDEEDDGLKFKRRRR
ncbi:hypothetical protein LTR56_007915 [Elasticomyces elasticus]|nr:hypothetical protein LTR22_022542 [Elasticomyces elasticus]KAK3647686.1 hypothetical protein LTR56_007915 [Elasticomyces elasticus]KAK4908103.1 hypothetical protein LTR49_022937 [Elasticomyces elasticus]KAK5738517.1 hypothetical protein LTS12_025558 [Elasticomyces elasticus]